MTRDISWTGFSAVCSRTISNRCRRLEGGVEEIRIWDDSGTYRVIYTARTADAVYVLHAFHKKTQITSKRDIATARERLAEIMKGQA